VSYTYGTYHIRRGKVPCSVCLGASTGMDGISTSGVIQRSRKAGFSRPDAICTCHDTGEASFCNAVLKAHGRGARCALRVRKSREARISAVGAIPSRHVRLYSQFWRGLSIYGHGKPDAS